MSGPGGDTGGDRSGGAGSGDATQRLPSQPGASGDTTQLLPSQPGGASSSPIGPDADLKHSKLVGYMSVPVHRLLPIRRSTLLMVVAFIGFGILLHTYPPQSAAATSAGTIIKGSDGQEYFVPSATKVSVPTTTTTTTTSTTTPDRVPPTTTATTVPHSSPTTTNPTSQTTTTVAPSTTTTTTAGSSDSTTTTALHGTTSTTVP